MRVLLIDDHALFRSGLQSLLERQGIEVVSSVGNGEEGIAKARELQPDIILLDIRMPEENGLAVLKRIVASDDISAKVVMVTTSTEDEDVIGALRGGARGYLLKDMEPEELIQALGKAQTGETVVAPELAGALARVVQGGEQKSHPDTPLDGLTPRELEILAHLAEGQSNKVIAKELGITDGTVKLHVKAILRKLKVQSRVEAAVLAVELGLGRKSVTS